MNFYDYLYRNNAKKAIAELLKNLNEAVVDMQMLEIMRIKNRLTQTANETSVVKDSGSNDRESPNLLKTALNVH